MMPEYRCRCTDASGRVRELTREAPSEEVLLRDLASAGLFPLSVGIRTTVADRRGGSALADRGGGNFRGRSPEHPTRRTKLKAVRDFTDSLSLMIEAGLSVRDALEVAETVLSDGRGCASRQLVSFVSERIGAGSSLSHCLALLGDTFPPLYRALVQIGERVGSLESVLKRLSDYLRRQKQMRDRISSALVYPLLVLCVAFAGVILVAAIVVPKASELFALASTELPSTVRRLTLSANLLVGLTVGLLTVAAAVFCVVRTARRAGGAAAARVDELLLRVPIAGRFLSMRAVAQFCFAMEILVESGVSVEDGLEESAQAIGNAALQSAAFAAREEVIQGAPLSSALLSRRVFPERIGRWIRIGERTGDVEQVFSQLRRYYENEVDRWSERAAALLEPALTLAVGAFLIVVILVFIVPLFSLYGSLVP